METLRMRRASQLSPNGSHPSPANLRFNASFLPYVVFTAAMCSLTI